jgi:hypothetical protein
MCRAPAVLCSVLCALCSVRCALCCAECAGLCCAGLGWAGCAVGAGADPLCRALRSCREALRRELGEWRTTQDTQDRTGQDRTGHAGRQASRQAGLWRCGALRSVCLHGMPAYACRCFDRTPTPCPAPGQRPYSPPAVRSSAPRMPSHGPERLGRGTLWLAGSWAGWLACVRRMLPACRVLVQQPPPLRVRHSVSE